MSTGKLYQTIADDLKRRIAEGAFREGERLPAEAKLGEEYHASRVTIRTALEQLQNEHVILPKGRKGRFIAPAFTRRDSQFSQQLTRIVSFITPLSGVEWALYRILDVCREILTAEGYFVSAHLTHRQSAKEREFILQAMDSQVAGVVLFPENQSDNLDLYYQLYKSHFPVVLLDNMLRYPPLSHVTSDNRRGGSLQAVELLDCGAADCFYVSVTDAPSCTLQTHTTVQERYFGFIDTLSEKQGLSRHGGDAALDCRHFPVPGALVDKDRGHRLLPDEERRLRGALGGLLEKARRPVGFAAENDALGQWLTSLVVRMGLRIPEDVLVIGFDDLDIYTGGPVPLSTVRQDLNGLGEATAHILLDQMGNRNRDTARAILPVELVPRASTRGHNPVHR